MQEMQRVQDSKMGMITAEYLPGTHGLAGPGATYQHTKSIDGEAIEILLPVSHGTSCVGKKEARKADMDVRIAEKIRMRKGRRTALA